MRKHFALVKVAGNEFESVQDVKLIQHTFFAKQYLACGALAQPVKEQIFESNLPVVLDEILALSRETKNFILAADYMDMFCHQDRMQ